MDMASIYDNHQRRLNYLRMSVTDKCNLRCQYCMPHGGMSRLPQAEILTYEEMLRLVDVFGSLGVSKVRVTGGEPLVRRGLTGFLRRLTGSMPGLDVRLTTNGLILAELAGEIAKAGVTKVNVSLDSLDAATFARITRHDDLSRVLGGIDAALGLGFDPVKINMVPLAGINDHEIADFGRLTIDRPLTVRFIEFMPVGGKSIWDRSLVVDTPRVIQRLAELGRLMPLPARPGDGPARRYKIEGAKGELGFISHVSDHFCPSCNRLRLTADGHLRPCLLSDIEVDIKGPLRSGATDDEVREIILNGAGLKPARPTHEAQRPMATIGG